MSKTINPFEFKLDRDTAVSHLSIYKNLYFDVHKNDIENSGTRNENNDLFNHAIEPLLNYARKMYCSFIENSYEHAYHEKQIDMLITENKG